MADHHRHRRPAGPPPWYLDALVVLWALGWGAVGIWTGIDVSHLGQLASTLATAASGLHDASVGIGRLSAVPFVGATFRHLSRETSATALQAASGAASSRVSIHQLAFLIGAAVGLAPSVPVIAAWLLWRSGPTRLGEPAAPTGSLEQR